MVSGTPFYTSALAHTVETKLTLTVTPVLTGNGTYQGGDVKLDALLTMLDDTPIQNVAVSFKANGTNSYSRTTDVSGVATFPYASMAFRDPHFRPVGDAVAPEHNPDQRQAVGCDAQFCGQRRILRPLQRLNSCAGQDQWTAAETRRPMWKRMLPLNPLPQQRVGPNGRLSGSTMSRKRFLSPLTAPPILLAIWASY